MAFVKIHCKLLQLSIFLGIYFFLTPAKAQWSGADSLINTFKPIASYYYLKPIWGQFQNQSTLQGHSRFTKTYPGNLFNTTFGLAIGYHRERWELETGILNLPVATGYRFPFEPVNEMYATGIGQSRRITYAHIPLIFRYTVWQPGKRFELRASAGMGLIWESSGIRFNPSSVSTLTNIGSNGTPRTVTSTTHTGNKESFLIGLAGLDLHWKLGRRLGANLSVKRVFSQKEIVWMDTTVEPYGEMVPYKTRAVGAANGFMFQLGLQYQFSHRKTYKPLEQDE
ncbi:hypothetical protein [Larkinella harenae]